MQEGNQQVGWQFQNGEAEQAAPGAAPASMPAAPSGSISWTASEYIEHDKSAGWYTRFGLVVILILATIYLFTRDWVSVALLSVLAIAFAIFAARKPSVLQYKLDNRGITIGQKFYPISLFRSFAVVDEGAFRSVTLMPLKRFMPAISLYYAPDEEQTILTAFASLLPQEIKHQDPLDRFMHRIRF